MAAVVESDSSFAIKCLDICQALTSQGKIFNFSLSIGPTFSFSFDSRDKTLDTRVGPTKRKKQSPSTLRRNAMRKEDYLNKRKQPLSAVKSTAETAPPSRFSCDQCDYTNASEKGLRQHKRMKHGKPQLEGQLHATSPSTPENLRKPISYSAALQVSPVEQSTGRKRPVQTVTKCSHQTINVIKVTVTRKTVRRRRRKIQKRQRSKSVVPMDQALCVPNVLCFVSAGTSNLQWIII